MPEVITLGETMAVLAPAHPGRLRHSAQLSLHVGGAESNVAVSLARLGVPSGWVSALGNDELGELVLARLRGEGVDCSRVSRCEAPTGLYLRDETGPGFVRAFYYRSGSAASTMGPGQLDDAYFAGARVLHISGITLALSASCRALVHQAVAAAHAHGVVVSFDVNFRAKLWTAVQARAAIEALLPQVDLLFVGDDEAQRLWHACDHGLMRRLSAGGPREVVLKRGAHGAVALADGELHHRRAFEVPLVDAVGAGDAFAAGYLAAMLWSCPPGQRLRYANAMGAYCVMSRGDCENAPSRAELDAFLEQQPIDGR